MNDIGSRSGKGPIASEGGNAAASEGFHRLKTFLEAEMSMSHVYQPLMIRTLLADGGVTSRRKIAEAFLMADLSQLEYYEQITNRYPTQTLKKHGIVEHQRGVYKFFPGGLALSDEERQELIRICDVKVESYIEKYEASVWQHRSQNFEPLPGSLRYRVLKRAMGRCEACGISNRERALHVDHILPRAKGGTNDLNNLQALCTKCNSEKLDRDDTDFHILGDRYAARDPSCPFCTLPAERILIENELAFVIRDSYPVTAGHSLIIPKRHVISHLELWQPELNAMRQLEIQTVDELKRIDPTISGLNTGSNTGESAGQTIFHCHVHLIPRRNGDAPSPRGGIRGVIPGKQSY